MKQIYALFFSLLTLSVYAQSDDPCGATALSVGASCSAQAGTTVGATNTAGVSTPSCSSLGKDVWYTMIVPASGSIIIETYAGTITDGGMALYNGTCGALTEIACDDDGMPGVSLMPRLNVSGLTPGATVWLRFWKYASGTGTFQICAYEGVAAAAPANDDPCSATTLSVNLSCVLTAGDNTGATASVAPAPGCSLYSGGDVWYQFVVPASGNVNIQSSPGGITDGAMAIYSGTCASLALLACDDDGGPGLMPEIDATGLTPGATIFIRFWEYGNDVFGSFQLCVWEPIAVAGGENNDCVNATQLCSTASFDDNSSGTGDISDLNGTNHGCLTSNERQPAWYIFQIATGGTFQLTIDPNTNSNDFDFGVWGPNPTCPPSSAPIRCSYSSKTNNTGINSTTNMPQTDASEDALGNRWVIDMNVIAGEIYLLMIDNFTMSNDGFAISFSGTATIDCSPLPIQLVAFQGENMNNYNMLSWNTQSEFNNNHFEVERSEDAESFETLGLVNGAGSTVNETDYQFIDYKPYYGNTYYRLKQVDNDGAYRYSETITVYNEAGTSLWVYPNPANGFINVSHKEVEGEQITLEIVNAFGQVIYHTRSTASGELNIDKVILPTRGMYWVILKASDKVLIQKIVN